MGVSVSISLCYYYFSVPISSLCSGSSLAQLVVEHCYVGAVVLDLEVKIEFIKLRSYILCSTIVSSSMFEHGDTMYLDIWFKLMHS